MLLPDAFFIFGKKKLIFRKEENEYISFDPFDLDFIKLNKTGAEILYLISKNTTYRNIIDIIAIQYGLSKEMIENDINNFIYDYPSNKIIKNNLIELVCAGSRGREPCALRGRR
jgi:hypothetical protein